MSISCWLSRWADEALTRQVSQLLEKLELAERTIKVQEAEIRLLSGVVARDIARVEAETEVLAGRKNE